jgi:hypothetical protein
VIHVVTAVITAQKGEHMTSITEQTETAQPVENGAAKPTKKARVAPRRANVAPKKAKSGKKLDREFSAAAHNVLGMIGERKGEINDHTPI